MCLLLALGAAVFQRGARAAHERSETAAPEAAALDFYKWYLGELVKGQEPLSAAKGALASYVTASLIEEIQKEISSPNGLEADYFTAAQDYADDWLTHINVQVLGLQHHGASLQVVLGASRDSKQPLRVQMVKEGALWKIAKVRAEPGAEVGAQRMR
jgi:hypothetical protein